MAKVTKLNEFHHGVFYSAQFLALGHNEPTIALHLLESAGLTNVNVSELPEPEQRALKKIMALDPDKVKFTGFTI